MNKKELTKEYGFWIIDGRYYQASAIKKDGKAVLVEVSNNEVKKKMKLLKDLSKRLKDNLDNEAVMMEALSKLEMDSLMALHNVVFNIKRKVRVKTRKGYCVDMKVGGLIIPIVE